MMPVKKLKQLNSEIKKIYYKNNFEEIDYRDILCKVVEYGIIY